MVPLHVGFALHYCVGEMWRSWCGDPDGLTRNLPQTLEFFPLEKIQNKTTVFVVLLC